MTAIRNGELFQRRMSVVATRTITERVNPNDPNSQLTIRFAGGGQNSRVFLSLLDDGSPGFRMKTEIRKYSELNPDNTVLEIYNLGPESRSFFQNSSPGSVAATSSIITINAGYGFDLKRIFVGNVVRTITRKVGPDFITRVELASGLFPFNNARINQAFGGNITFQESLNTLAASFAAAGLNVPSPESINNLVSDTQFSGINFSGRTATQLQKVLEGSGFTAVITDNSLRIIPENGTLPNPPILLTTNPTPQVGPSNNANSGSGTDNINGFPIVGIPEVGTINLTVKTLLNADLVPFQPVIINSKFVNGLYRIRTVQHIADTFEGEFLTVIETNRAFEDGTTGTNSLGVAS